MIKRTYGKTNTKENSEHPFKRETHYGNLSKYFEIPRNPAKSCEILRNPAKSCKILQKFCIWMGRRSEGGNFMRNTHQNLLRRLLELGSKRAWISRRITRQFWYKNLLWIQVRIINSFFPRIDFPSVAGLAETVPSSTTTPLGAPISLAAVTCIMLLPL